MPPETAKVYDSGSFFGDLVSGAKEIGQSYLNFSWDKYKFDQELALSGKYRQAVNDQQTVNSADINKPSTNTGDLYKYGGLAVGGLIVALVLFKVFK